MYLISLVFILNAALAKNLSEEAKILSELKIPAGSVSISVPAEAEMDNEFLNKDDITINIRGPVRYMGNDLTVGSAIYYRKGVGVTSIAQYRGGPFVTEGFACSGHIKFLERRMCKCSLARPHTLVTGVELPKNTQVGLKNGQLVWFHLVSGLVEEFSNGHWRRIDEPKVGGVSVHTLKVYALRNGKVVEHGKYEAFETYCDQ